MKIALTFDTEPPQDGNHPDNARLILDALRERGVAATFFVQGEWAERYPELATRLVVEGHRVGNHTYAHALPGELSPDELVAEIERGAEVIERLTGADPRPLFRCPQNSGAFDERVLSTIDSAGYRQVGWTFDSFDWQQGMTAHELWMTVLRGVDAHPEGSVVLLHSWPDATAAALPDLLDELISAGAEFVTL